MHHHPAALPECPEVLRYLAYHSEHVTKIKKALIINNDPLLIDYLKQRHQAEPNIMEYDLLKDIFTAQQYNEWKEKSGLQI